MYLNYLNIFLIILLNAITKSTSDIINCSFVNTVNLTDETYLYNKSIEIPIHLVGDYNYEILKDGSKITAIQHKRGCICPDPCLSLCTNTSLEFYGKYPTDDSRSIFVKTIQLENGLTENKSLITHFNHRIGDVVNCNQTYILFPEDNDGEEWTLFENGTLFHHYSRSYLNQENYCFELSLIEDEFVHVNPYICGLESQLSDNGWSKSCAMACSVPFFILTVFVYRFLPEFQNCHGKCFVMYLICVASSYTLLSFVTLSGFVFPKIPCLMIGYSIYFTTIASLTWTGILSFDTWKTLTRVVASTSFRKYLLWGLLIPTLATTLTFLAQTSELEAGFKPGIEERHCGVNTKYWSATIYYFIPHIVVLVYSLSMYIIVLRYIADNENGITGIATNIKRSHKKRFFLYFRLFSFMGVTWFLDILSYFLYVIFNFESNIILISDLFTALNGIFVFFTFICRPNIFRRLKKRLSSRKTSEHRKTFSNFSGHSELNSSIEQHKLIVTGART